MSKNVIKQFCVSPIKGYIGYIGDTQNYFLTYSDIL